MIKDIERYYSNIEKTLKENPELRKLKGCTILITGGNGLIGSCIIDVLEYLNKFERSNINIISMVRNKDNIDERFLDSDNITIIQQDVVEKLSYNGKIDYIIHAASNSHPKAFSTDPVGTILGNIIGMNNILEFAKESGCKRVEYISSGEIYGQSENENENFTENYIGKQDSLVARSCYPISKKSSENLCVSYSQQYGIETVIARPCHCYGPTQTEKDSRASAQFVRDALEHKDIVMKSEGKQVRSYIYVVDCAVGILTILLNGDNCNAYNVANNKSILSIRDLAKIIAETSNGELKIELPNEEEKRGYNPVTRSVLDGSKLESIGWNPCWNVKEGIQETLEIMR